VTEKMDYYDNAYELFELVRVFIEAPIDNPDIVPTILPLVAGAVVIELYFGKHKTEELGWNTSVGNAVIWVSTGLTLYITETLTTPELYATLTLIGLGTFIGYMDFFHKWSPAVAYTVSSAGVIYTLAYILVIFVKTPVQPVGENLYGAAVFFLGTILAFKLIQGFETDQRRNQFSAGINSL